MSAELLLLREKQAENYLLTWQAMKDFTEQRSDDTLDELWLLEHPAVFTQGQAGKAEHILQATSIPIVQSDRGGQVTYHGPGQIILYCLLNLKRKGLGVRDCVSLLEQVVIATLADFSIVAELKASAPGVYVAGSKIASLGLRVRKGCTYHGLSLNVNMDLSPFAAINPCGYQGLAMTQMADLIDEVSVGAVQASLLAHFAKQFDYHIKAV
jgi:lipoyl(octanoyl) transferase